MNRAETDKLVEAAIGASEMEAVTAGFAEEVRCLGEELKEHDRSCKLCLRGTRYGDPDRCRARKRITEALRLARRQLKDSGQGVLA